MEARVNFVTEELNRANSALSLDKLQDIASTGTKLSVADARGFSLLGEIVERQGDAQTAEKLFTHALDLSKTEIHALQKKFIGHLRADDEVGAVETLDFILRRWPTYKDRLAVFLPPILSREKGLQKAAELFAQDEDLLNNVLGELYKKPEWLPTAQALMMQISKDETLPMRPYFKRMVRELVSANKPYEAFRFFQFTMDDDDRALNGYIYNSKFLGTPAGHQFDWEFKTHSGVTTDLVTLATDKATGKPTERMLQISFRNSPVQFSDVKQIILLPRGRYEVSIDFAADGLTTPKPLYFNMICRPAEPPYFPVLRMRIPSGTQARNTISQAFDIPDDKPCPLQYIYIDNDKIAGSSWKTRYNGDLNIYEIKVTKAPEAQTN